MKILRAPRHHEAYFSLGLRSEEIEQLIDDDDPDTIVNLGSHCNSVRTAEQLINCFGINEHPVLVAARAEVGVKNQKLMELARPIIYRCDIASQQHALTTAGETIGSEKKRRKKIEEAAAAAHANLEGEPIEMLLRAEAQHHIRSHRAARRRAPVRDGMQSFVHTSRFHRHTHSLLHTTMLCLDEF